MGSYKIAVLHGDGTGPEVMREGLKVLAAASKKFGYTLNLTDYDLGGVRYKRTGETLSDATLNELRGFDALYLSALGSPEFPAGVLERDILLKMRFSLDQYINLRPVKLYEGVKSVLARKGPKEIDFIVVRENTEGLYAGTGGIFKKDTPDEVAIQTSVNTRKGVERCLRYAFKLAQTRPRKQLHLVGKNNVLTYAFDLWTRAFEEIGQKDFPDVKRAYHHVDACCMYMIDQPEVYDVIVTDNMFGDIITDVGGIIQGGLGVAASGNINPDKGGVSMFEPVGGTAPQFTGQNVINPLACIKAGGMMLDHLGEKDAARAIELAVAKISGELPGLGVNQMGCGTTDVGDRVVKALE
ncbi:3-isopropylmalate dehydrogenase [soil metagenome]